jgi:DNA-binding SARP family transcriptional activator/predicted RNA-binding Zn ribbon-like protein
MEFHLLGPFEARYGGDVVEIGSRRQERLLLAILLCEAGRLVPTARVIELLWGDRPPSSARSAVHTYIGRLRAALAPYGVRISTRADGYLVQAEDVTVDVHEFAATVRQATELTEPQPRVELLDRALRLWRGPLLAGLAPDALRDLLGAQLDETRLLALEMRAESRLQLGHDDQVIAETTDLAAAHPTRERLVGALMTALYRDGRQADALLLYDRTRRALADGLGVDPGAQLAELHRRILRRDPRLDPPRRMVYEVRLREESLPWSVSGHPALDFCNTYAGWRHEPPLPGSEWLRGYRTLAVWCGFAGLADEAAVSRLCALAERDPAGSAAVLDEARRVRARLYACLTDEPDRAAFGEIAGLVREAARQQVFTPADGGGGRWRTDLAAGLRLPLHAAVWAAAGLLSEPRRLAVRACPNPRCGWLFLDESGQRRFCSLATCGGSEARGEFRWAEPAVPVGR